VLPPDQQLRGLYRLLDLTEGEQAEQVLSAIRQRRCDLERETVLPPDASAFGLRHYQSRRAEASRFVNRSRAEL
jgi:hypothetical protein